MIYYLEYFSLYRVKSTLKEKRGVRRDRLAFYLDEFMWRERYGKSRTDAFQRITEQISQKYPLP